MASRRQKVATRSIPRLYLVIPTVEATPAFARDLISTLGAADIAAVLLRLANGEEGTLIECVKTIAPLAQDRAIALVLDGRPDIAIRAGADGAHLTGIDDFNAALSILKPGRIAGAAGLTTRHDAMRAAEAGADYVMFGERAVNGQRPSVMSILERITWWAEIFETPCVAFAESLEEIAPFADAGADFVAVGEFIFRDRRGSAAAIAAAAEQLALTEPLR